VKKQERDLAWMKSLLGKTDHYGGILPYRIKHHGALKGRGDLPKNVNAFGFQQTKIVESVTFHGFL
jgi:hypothetical protein